MTSYWLPILVLLPALFGAVMLIARRRGMSDSAGECLGWVGAVATLIVAFVAGSSMYHADLPDGSAQIAPRVVFAPAWLNLRMPAVLDTNHSGWQLALGLDGIGYGMVLLTTIVTLAVLVIARSTVEKERSDFAAWLLLSVSGLLLVFTAMDLVLFYVGFEWTLVPLFALIALWGDEEAPAAARRFVLYTLAGSIPMVLGLLGIAQLYGNEGGWTIGFSELSQRAATAVTQGASLDDQWWVFALLVLGLGVKMALIPFHTWLPKTYGSSHPTCGAFLAAVVLKLGLFGYVRLVIPMLPLACKEYGPSVMGALGALAVVAGALMALSQTDLRLLLAYSSLSHVGFVTIGLFALNEMGITGAVLQMFNHGITTAAVFLAASCIITRRGTSRLDEGGTGIASRYPKLAMFMIFFLVAGAGVPGLNNFVGEALALTAMLPVRPFVTVVAALGIVLGAWYAFQLMRSLLFGEAESDRFHEKRAHRTDQDVGFPEKVVFASLAIVCLYIGIFPQGAIDIFHRDARSISQVCDLAMKSQSPAPAEKNTP